MGPIYWPMIYFGFIKWNLFGTWSKRGKPYHTFASSLIPRKLNDPGSSSRCDKFPSTFTPKKTAIQLPKKPKMVRFPMFFQESQWPFFSRWISFPPTWQVKTNAWSFCPRINSQHLCRPRNRERRWNPCCNEDVSSAEDSLGAEENMGRCRNQCIVMYIDDVYMNDKYMVLCIYSIY